MSAAAAQSRRDRTAREVPLPRGRVLVIRPVRAGDVDGLAALYAGLDSGSLHRRFFSTYRPTPSFFERMVAVAERGGAGLVATVAHQEDGSERIVGEAGYELLANGDGELAITVDRAWRGWLGPYLLDALVDAAASRGVPNLEADILITNGPMLALFRSRGYAFMPSADWSAVRTLIGAATPTPTWPGVHGGFRVLVEGAGSHWHAADAAKADGLEVLSCPGPVGRGSPCPVLAGQPCPLAVSADAIVISHPSDTDAWRSVRTGHSRLHPGVPVCVQLPHDGGEAAPGETAVPACAAVDVVAFIQRLAGARAARRETMT